MVVYEYCVAGREEAEYYQEYQLSYGFVADDENLVKYTDRVKSRLAAVATSLQNECAKSITATKTPTLTVEFLGYSFNPNVSYTLQELYGIIML
jgi:hypothetical protein